jgi:hypothetical protein
MITGILRARLFEIMEAMPLLNFGGIFLPTSSASM